MNKKEKLINITETVLNKTFKQSAKQKVMVYTNRLNFACPFCLDSDVNLFAKRGNIYLEYNIYRCYNDGCKNSYMTLVKYLNQVDGLKQFDFNEIDELQTKTISRKNYKKLAQKALKKLLIPRDVFKQKYNLLEPSNGCFLFSELEKRRLLQFKHKFLMDIKKSRLFILNCDENGDVLGYQIRNYVKGLPKYTTHKYSEIIKDFPELNIHIIDEGIIHDIDKKSVIFSIFEIDLEDELTVFEGPIDSFFYPSSVSFSGIKNAIIDTNYKYFFDNDETGLNKSIELLRKGFKVFLWNKFITNYKQFVGCKDLNSIYEIDKDFDVKIFEDYFSTSEFDIFDLIKL